MLLKAVLFEIEAETFVNKVISRVCAVLSRCRVQLFVTLWTIAHQAPLSMGIFQARILA